MTLNDRVAIKLLREMSNKLKDWAAILEVSAIAIEWSHEMAEAPHCENCQRQGCEYKDNTMRFNCPLWKGSAV